MRKIVLFKIGSKNASLPKLVGIFLIIISVIMLIQSSAVMFDSWQAIKGFNNCVDDAFGLEINNDPTMAVLSELKYQDCKNSFYQITGAQVAGNQKFLTSRESVTAFSLPLVSVFFWAMVLWIALLIFNNASVVVPVEQVEIPLNISNGKKTKKKKKKK